MKQPDANVIAALQPVQNQTPLDFVKQLFIQGPPIFDYIYIENLIANYEYHFINHRISSTGYASLW